VAEKRKGKPLTRQNVRELLVRSGNALLLRLWRSADNCGTGADRSRFYSIDSRQGNPTDFPAPILSGWWRKGADDGYDLSYDFRIDAILKAFLADKAFRVWMHDDRIVLQATTG
jgi:hypothetical protein